LRRWQVGEFARTLILPRALNPNPFDEAGTNFKMADYRLIVVVTTTVVALL